MKLFAILVLALALIAQLVHGASVLPEGKACRTDWCGGFAGFACCEGYTCLAATQCCDFPGKCVPKDPNQPTPTPAVA